MLFGVWSCVPWLRLCELDGRTDGAFDGADGADFDAVDDEAAGIDDAVDDVVDDDKEAHCSISAIMINSDASNSVINTSRLIISNINISTISNIKNTIRMIINR